MSTLTKVLIILLSIGAIFLSGIVVTYVATSENYREQHQQVRTERDSAREQMRQCKEQLNEQIQQSNVAERELKSQITELQQENTQLANDMESLRRENQTLTQRVANWSSVVEDFEGTISEQQKMLENTQANLQDAESRNVKLDKELKETSQELIQQMGIIETMRTENRQLVEQRSELRSRLDQLLAPYGETAVEAEPVTRAADQIQPAEQPTAMQTEPIELTAEVTEVDMQDEIASISVGSADGVEEGMRFHVIRGNNYICDILITEVQPEKAVGGLELVQQKPQQGDMATTNY